MGKADEADGLSPINEDNETKCRFGPGKPCVPLASDANAKRKEVEATAMLERIISYLSEQLDIPAEEMNRNTTFESLHLDSLDMVEMVMDMDEELGVDFDMDGKLEVNTIGELADLIEEKLSEIG